MTIRPRILRIVAFLACFVPLMCATATETAAQNPGIDELQLRLIEDGIAEETVATLFTDSRFEVIPKLLKVNIKQPSGKAGYERFVGSASVRTAVSFLDSNREEIEAVLDGSPVNPEVIVAILNVESSFGTYKGTYPLMNVFASLTLLDTKHLTHYAPTFWNKVLEDIPETELETARTKANKRRSSKSRWAYRQLKALMEMAETNHMDPLSVRGSWAGAYGLPQFIPTSALAYGRDGNGDGIVNLNELADAVASIEYYLKKHRYDRASETRRRKAVWHYNHSEDYVNCILTLADRIAEEAEKEMVP